MTLPKTKRTQWPPHMFDYERQRVTDPDVAELDMARGEWVRCNKCADSVLKSAYFTDSNWRSHKKTLKHQAALGRPVHPQRKKMVARVHVPSPSPPRDYHAPAGVTSPNTEDFSAALLQGAHSDQEFLSLCYKGIAKQKSERTKFEADVHEVVDAMTSLVTDQQDELDAMRRTMEANARELRSLVENVRVLKKTQSQRGDELRASQRSPALLHHTRHDSSAANRIQAGRSPLFIKAARESTKHQGKRPSPHKCLSHRSSVLQRPTRSPFSRHGAKELVSPSLFSPAHRSSSALQRLHKTHTELRSHEKAGRDPFEYDEDEDDDDDSTRRMLHMSQYA